MSVEFVQPNPDQQIFHSTEATPGYIMKRLNSKTWDARHNNVPIGAEAPKNRAEAEALIQEHAAANPATAPDSAQDAPTPAAEPTEPTAPATAETPTDPAAPDAPEKPKQLVNGSDVKVFEKLKELSPDNAPFAIDTLARSFEDRITAMAIVYRNAKKGYILVSDDNDFASITPEGEAALLTYTPPAPRAKKPVDPNAPAKAPRIQKERPEGLGPAPTELEFLESRLDNAQATKRHTAVLRRRHPFSEIIAKKVVVADERVQAIEEEIAYYKEHGKLRPSPSKVEEAAEASDNATTA